MLMRHILHIEHEHSNVMLYQLALQAVLERCINNSTSHQQTDKPIAPQVLEQWYGNDRQYVKLLMHSCRNVLRIVVDGLAPGGYLKHAPVRTFFRIVSMTMVLVKVRPEFVSNICLRDILTLLPRPLLLAPSKMRWPYP